MNNDILFHITTKKEWQEYKTNGNYEPQSLASKGFILCSSGSQLEDTANRLYSDKNKILLLVIDVSRLGENIKYEEDESTGDEFPHIQGPLNTNAVVDQIEVATEDDGQFHISFSSNS